LGRRALRGDPEGTFLESKIDAFSLNAWEIHLNVIRIVIFPNTRGNIICLDAATARGAEKLVDDVFS